MTNELRKLIREKLLDVANVKEVYFGEADDKKLYPHIVVSFDGINSLNDDNNRKDYRLLVDVWDKSKSPAVVNDITDAVIKLFNKLNAPQDSILPTFYFETTNLVIDEDKAIKHSQTRFTVQNYER